MAPDVFPRQLTTDMIEITVPLLLLNWIVFEARLCPVFSEDNHNVYTRMIIPHTLETRVTSMYFKMTRTSLLEQFCNSDFIQPVQYMSFSVQKVLLEIWKYSYPFGAIP